MLNLLRFRERSGLLGISEVAPSQPISGRDAYDLYVHHTIPFLEKSGGSVSPFATGDHYFVVPAEERRDLAMLIRQTSLAHFFAFASNTAYLAGIGHRTAALEDSELLPLIDEPLP
jgi:hypothetical protein